MPNEAWTSIALDFIVKLPESIEPLTGITYNSILVINNRLTKMVYLEPFREAMNAEGMAYTFLKTIFTRYRMPKEIISDRDKLFISQFWQSLMDLMGTKHKLSMAYC